MKEIRARKHSTVQARRRYKTAGTRRPNRALCELGADLANPRPYYLSNHAFTLMELLVVLGIISVLAGLLLPVLARAKSSVRSVSCRNNLKQLQAGYLMYAQDN